MTGADIAGPTIGETGRRPRLLRWLIAIGLGVPLALVVLAASPLGADFFYVVIGIPALLLIWAAAATAALIVSVRSALRRDWRRCALASLLPIALLVVALDPIRFVRACNTLGDMVHFVVAKPYYDRKVAALPAAEGPRLAVFNWGGMVWASSGVVYDESDQVARPQERQFADWRERASRTELACEGYGVRPLWDHYYLVSFPC